MDTGTDTQDDGRDAARPLRPLLVCLGLFGGGGVASALLETYEVLTVPRLVERCVVGAALTLAAFHLLNGVFRCLPGHWRVARLRPLLWRELGLGFVAMLAVAIAGLALDPTLAVLAGMIVVLAIASLAYVPLHVEIRRVLAEEGLDHCTAYLGKRTPYVRLAGSDRDVATTAGEADDEHPQKLISWLLASSPRTKLSRIRSLVASTLALTLVVALLGPVGVVVSELADDPALVHGLLPVGAGPAKKPHPKRPRSDKVDRGPDAGQRKPGAKPLRPAPPVVRSAATNWEEVCSSLPGDGAPPWAAPHLNALYLGGMKLNADPPPGAFQGGCTGATYVPDASDGAFVYKIGTDRFNGDAKSVAVDSIAFGPAIFLAPAAMPVLELIREFGVVGGLPRTPVANGDLYAVKTTMGTVILVRAQKSLSGSELAQPYTVLLPVIAAAWLGAMKAHGTWLWPLPGTTRGGRQSVHLVAGPVDERVVETITFDPQARSARLGAERQRSYGPTGADIGLDELAEFIARAR